MPETEDESSEGDIEDVNYIKENNSQSEIGKNINIKPLPEST